MEFCQGFIGIYIYIYIYIYSYKRASFAESEAYKGSVMLFQDVRSYGFRVFAVEFCGRAGFGGFARI